MIEDSVFSFLTSDLTIASLVGQRVYPSHLPQSATLPALVYNLVSNPHDHHLDGASGVSVARIQIDCYSTSLSACASVIEAVRQALQGYRGTMGTQEVLASTLVDERNFAERPQDGSDIWIHRKSADYLIKFRHSIPSF